MSDDPSARPPIDPPGRPSRPLPDPHPRAGFRESSTATRRTSPARRPLDRQRDRGGARGARAGGDGVGHPATDGEPGSHGCRARHDSHDPPAPARLVHRHAGSPVILSRSAVDGVEDGRSSFRRAAPGDAGTGRARRSVVPVTRGPSGSPPVPPRCRFEAARAPSGSRPAGPRYQFEAPRGPSGSRPAGRSAAPLLAEGPYRSGDRPWRRR